MDFPRLFLRKKDINRAINKKKYVETHDKMLDILKKCGFEKKVGKKFSGAPIGMTIDKEVFIMVFEPPARVVNTDYEAWTITLKMRATLVTENPDIPNNKGTVHVQYSIAFDEIKETFSFSGATISETTFAERLLPHIKDKMKKRAKKLGLKLEAKECF